MATLYELTGQYLTLLDMASDADPEVFADTLESLDGEIEEKAENYAKVIKTLEGDTASIDAEIKRLQGKKTVLANNIKNIKSSLENAMRATGKVKFKTVLFSFGIQKNPATVTVKDEKYVPGQFWKTPEPVLDKRGLIEFIKKNGNTAYAELTQTESLRIR